MYALSVGFRYLRSKKRKTISAITVIAVAGVALGVAALLAVMAITGGFQKAFRDKILGVNAHVLVLKYGLDFSEYRDVIDHAEKLREVEGASPFLIHEMMLAKGSRLSGVLVKGIDLERTPRVLDLPSQMREGSLDSLRVRAPQTSTSAPAPPRTLLPGEEDLDAYLRNLDAPEQNHQAPEPEPAEAREPNRQQRAEPENKGRPAKAPPPHVPTPEEMEKALAGLGGNNLLPDDATEARLFEGEHDVPAPQAVLPGVIVGAALAESLDLELGDAVRIISPLAGLDTSMWAENAASPRALDFRVTGIFSAGFQEYDTRLVYVDVHEAQRFFDHGDSVTGVEIRLSDIDRAPEVARRLEADLGGGPYHTMDWEELNHNLFTALEVQKVMLSLVIATIIFVAAFNVIATLIMIVLEKKREVAILKAMGAKDSGVLIIFLVQGIVIGLMGTLLGLALGGLVTGYLSVYTFPLDPKVYLIDHLPVLITPREFAYTIAIALGICTAATLIPSYWAARLLPAAGVRYE